VTSNLTRDEAATRSALITVSSYQVDLDLTGDEKTFRSVSVIRFGCAAPGSSTFLNLTAPAVHEITLNDEPVSLDAFDGDRITLTGLAAGNVLRVTAACAYSHSGEGLHRFTDPADGDVYMYSDLETFDAHRIYACFDQPDMKARYELTVRAPQSTSTSREWLSECPTSTYRMFTCLPLNPRSSDRTLCRLRRRACGFRLRLPTPAASWLCIRKDVSTIRSKSILLIQEAIRNFPW